MTLGSTEVGHPAAARATNALGKRNGVLILNADDWGRDQETTDRCYECVVRGSLSSVSAMVFTADSDRAANIACEKGVDAGLHLNFTTPFTRSGVPTKLVEAQQRVTAHLRRGRWAPLVYQPALAGSFQYVVQTQLEEFHRLYGKEPDRLDGHHHMHLCANVLWGGLLPNGIKVRRNFSFAPGEKSFGNRIYRKFIDEVLARQHRLTDFLFSLPPLDAHRLEKIFALAGDYKVEVETHPVNPKEYYFLTHDIDKWTLHNSIAQSYTA